MKMKKIRFIDNQEEKFYTLFINDKNEKLVFFPVPKNANTSVRSFILDHFNQLENYEFPQDNIPESNLFSTQSKKLNLIGAIYRSKQSFTDIKSVLNDIKLICITRDPLKRFVSAYKNRILWHGDKEFNNYSIDDILANLEVGNFANQHFLPQSYFLGSSLKYFDFHCDVDEISKFESYINTFFNQKRIFPRLQTGGKKMKINLTEEQISRIKKIYEQDYNLLTIYNQK